MRSDVEIGLKRSAELCAAFMIGNGVLGLVQPDRRVALWTSDRGWIDRFVRADRARSETTKRLIAAGQVLAGLALASGLRA